MDTCSLHGTIVRFISNDLIAVLETGLGEAYLDISSDYDFRLQVGDRIAIDDTGYYIQDGKIVAVLGRPETVTILWINDFRVTVVSERDIQ